MVEAFNNSKQFFEDRLPGRVSQRMNSMGMAGSGGDLPADLTLGDLNGLNMGQLQQLRNFQMMSRMQAAGGPGGTG